MFTNILLQEPKTEAPLYIDPIQKTPEFWDDELKKDLPTFQHPYALEISLEVLIIAGLAASIVALFLIYL